jgi:phosphatidylglycerol:prolipoprotein diacylglycerol transferase
MHPILFKIPVPPLLQPYFGSAIPIYTYAFLIVAGAVMACSYIKHHCKKKLGITVSNTFFYSAFFLGYVGGKVLFFLENPSYYFVHPFKVFSFGGGFVIYGSLLFIAVYTYWYARKKNINVYSFLDIVSVASLQTMSLGRLGCYFGGCCYGKPTLFFTGLSYPTTAGLQHIHPVQLYDAFILAVLFVALHRFLRHKIFAGQVFIYFICLYAFERFILEFFRGDFRGSLFNGTLSHAQAIGIVTFCCSALLYHKLYKQTFKNLSVIK